MLNSHSILKTITGKQKLYDDTIFTAKVIAIKNNKILLLKNKKREYELPGGRLKVGETPIDGAQREFVEETGVAVRIIKPLKRNSKRTVFYGIPAHNNIRISNEHVGFVFIPLSAAGKLNLSINCRRDLKGVVC